MPLTSKITVHLTAEEHEWFRRKAHWEEASLSGLIRAHIHAMVREEGYLRPPDDEPQDFGFEKEQMQFVISLEND